MESRLVVLLTMLIALVPQQLFSAQTIDVMDPADGSFETGNGWTVQPAFYADSRFGSPHSGTAYAYLSLPDGSRGNELSGVLYSDSFVIPANATLARFSFYLSISTYETTTSEAFDTLKVFLTGSDPGETLIEYGTISNLDDTSGAYTYVPYNLTSAYYNRPLRLRFEGRTDASLETVFRIDSVRVTATVPTPPGALFLSAGAPYCDTSPPPIGPAVVLSWSQSTGADYYRVYRNGSQISGDITGTQFTNEVGLIAGQSYQYVVEAFNGDGSTESNTVTVSIPSDVCAAYDPPGDLGLSAGIPYCDTSPPPIGPAVVLSWSQSTGADFYRLYRDGAQVGGDLTGTQFTNEIGLNPGQSYEYVVRAFNNNGNTPSDPVSVAIPSDICAAYELPGSFDLSVSNPYCDPIPPAGPAVDLNWTTSDGADLYTVYRDGAVYPPGEDLTGTSFTNNVGLVPGATYTFSVRAENGNGSTDSNTEEVVISWDVCDAPPGYPGNFAVSHETPFCDPVEPEGPAVRINWTASSGAETYTLYRDGVPYVNGFGILGTTFLNNLNLDLGEAYEYSVVAHNETGDTVSTNSVVVGIPFDVCDERYSSLDEIAPVPEEFDAGDSVLVVDPLVGDLAVSVSDDVASLAVSVDPQGFETVVHFEWGIAPSPTETSDVATLARDQGTTAVGAELADLACGTTFVAKVVASNSPDSVESGLVTFATDPCPEPPGSFTLSHVSTTCDNKGNATVNLSWTTASGVVDYAVLRDGQERATTSGSSFAEFVADGQAYTYVVRARNHVGSTDSNGVAVSVPLDLCTLAPTASTSSPGSVTTTSATLNGTVNPRGAATDAWFEWGVGSAFDRATARVSVGAGGSTIPVSTSVAVACETSYQYRAVAQNAGGVAVGQPVSFTAQECPPGAPALEISTPATVREPSQHTYSIQWLDHVPDTDARIALYYDTDDSGADGTLIVSGISEDDPGDSFLWHTTFVPEGEYWIYGVIDDGVNPPAVAYAPGSVQVSHATPLTVCGSGCDYTTLDTAIADAVPGSRIELAAGIFPTGQLIIDKELTIQGAGVGATILRPTQDSGTSGDARGWLVVHSGIPFRLGDITLDASGYQLWQGIRHRGSGLVERVRFTDIGFNPSTNYQGTALVAYGDAPVYVLDSEFERIGRTGVLFFGQGVAGSHFRNSTYVGKGDGDFLDYGVEVGAGASVKIAGATISACRGIASADGSISAGIAVNTFYGSGSEATISGSSLLDSTIGISVGVNASDTSTVAAHYNQFLGNGLGIRSLAPSVAGESNYWGSDTGPAHASNPEGVGDAVDDEVTFLPFLASWAEDAVFQSFSPVDLEVVVAGLSTTKGQLGIPSSTYDEGDFNGDGDTNDRVTIANAPPGRYRVMVHPDETAVPGDTYSLTLTTGTETLVLASDAPVPVGFMAEQLVRKHTDGSVELLDEAMTPPTVRGGFEEGSGATVLLGEGLEGTLTGGVSWGPGQGGSALAFDGSGYVLLTDDGASPLDFSSALTVALWIRPDALGGTQVLVSKDEAYELEIGKLGADRYDLRLGNVVVGQGNSGLHEGVWQHVAVTWDGLTVRYYLDGEPDGEAAYALPLPSNDSNVGIGARPSDTASGGPTFFFHGAIDDVVLYNRALSADEIMTMVVGSRTDVMPPQRFAAEQTVVVPDGPSAVVEVQTSEGALCRASSESGTAFSAMTSMLASADGLTHTLTIEGLASGDIISAHVRCADALGNTNQSDFTVRVGVGATDLAHGLVAFYPFDEGSGCTAYDATGANDALLGPSCPADAPMWVPGVLGSALELAGGPQEAVVASPSGLSTLSALTMSAWVRHAPTTGNYVAIIDRRDAGADGFDLFFEPSSRLLVRVNTVTATSSRVVADGAWHHVVATYDGSEVRLYVDGVLDTTALAAAGVIETSGALHLGRHFAGPDYSFNGVLDEVLLYGRALSEVEVLDLSGVVE